MDERRKLWRRRRRNGREVEVMRRSGRHRVEVGEMYEEVKEKNMK